MLTETQLRSATEGELEELASRITRELEERRAWEEKKPGREVVEKPTTLARHPAARARKVRQGEL